MKLATPNKDKEMVTPTIIAEIAQERLHSSISLDNTLGFGITCYEKGMEEVLRQIAIRDLERVGFYMCTSKYTKKESAKTDKMFQELKTTLNNEEIEKLEEYDDAFMNFLAAEAGDYYIEGFLRGYRHLKTFLEFHTNFKGEYES